MPLLSLALVLMSAWAARPVAAMTLGEQLRQEPLVVAATPLDGPALRRFYAARDGRPAWTPAKLRELVGILAAAGEDGLDPANYHLTALKAALGRLPLGPSVTPAVKTSAPPPHAAALSPPAAIALTAAPATAPAPEATPEPSITQAQAQAQAQAGAVRAVATAEIDPALDLLASDAVLRYASDMGRGRIEPRRVDLNWSLDVPALDPVAVLESAVAGDDSLAPVLSALAPADPRYRRLKQALADYRALAAAGGRPLVAEGPSLKSGMKDPRVAQLRARLGLTGSDDSFDPALTEAVMAFQRRHGLEPDGLVGAITLRALNRTLDERIATITANLERWRWLPRDFGASYLIVNIPAQQLTAFENGKPVFQMRTVVGAPNKATPMLRSRVTAAIFAPSWHIPRKIAAREILPKLKRDPRYLLENDMRIAGLDGDEAAGAGIDWQEYRAGNFPYSLMQLPGDKNALGRVKFIFANGFDVYMHDTPARKLFATYARAQSHGCVRLEHPAQLAEWLLRDGRGWDAEKIAAELARTDTLVVPVRAPVPVYLLYFTAWVDDDGTVQFRDDIYHWDAKLLHVLERRAQQHGAAGQRAS